MDEKTIQTIEAIIHRNSLRLTVMALEIVCAFLYKRRKQTGMVHAFALYFLKKHFSIGAHGSRTTLCGCLYIKYN